MSMIEWSLSDLHVQKISNLQYHPLRIENYKCQSVWIKGVRNCEISCEETLNLFQYYSVVPRTNFFLWCIDTRCQYKFTVAHHLFFLSNTLHKAGRISLYISEVYPSNNTSFAIVSHCCTSTSFPDVYNLIHTTCIKIYIEL